MAQNVVHQNRLTLVQQGESTKMIFVLAKIPNCKILFSEEGAYAFLSNTAGES